MLKVFSQGNKVLIDLCGRKECVILSSLQADNLAGSLLEHAIIADKEPAELIKMEVWNLKVTNREHKVVMMVKPPEGKTTNIIPMPVRVARQVADLLRTNAEMAGYGLQIKFLNRK